MLTRIVRLHIKEEYSEDFLTLFKSSEKAIRSFKGCLHLEIFRDISHKEVFYTLSKWESEKHLNAYRNSKFFQETWKIAKVLFKYKAITYSLVPIVS